MAVPPHRILVPVDFSIFSARAAAVANDFARRFHSKLTLLHVIDSSEPEAASTFGLARRVAGRLRLSQFVGAVQPTSNTRQIIAVGKTAHEIAALAGRSRTDLILIGAHGHGESARERFIGLLESDVAVMGRKGRSELWHFVFGSLAECIVRRASCPVLVVQGNPWTIPAEERTLFVIRKIILATDLSSNSVKAFPLAQTLAREFGASVVMSHVLPPRQSFLRASEVKRLRNEAAERLARMRYQCLSADLPVETCLLDGTPDQALGQAARVSHCDLIVVSGNGGISVRDALLGGVAERVVRHAPCPVLVVP